MTDELSAILIIEILGTPAEHIKSVLETIIDKLDKENNVKIVYKKIAEPKELEQKESEKKLFTSFAEIEIKTNLQKLMLLIFNYMPSHVEIISPEELKVKNSDLNLFFNELTKKLHQYDEIVKAVIMERQIIAKQIQEGRLNLKNQKKKTSRKN